MTTIDIGSALRRHAADRPDAIGLTMSGSAGWSYGKLDSRARAVAATVAQRCRPGDRVLLVIDAGADFVAAFYGCVYAGAVPVPLAFRADQAALAAVGAIAADAEPSLALVGRELAASAAIAGLTEAVGVEVLSMGAIDDAAAGDWQPGAPGDTSRLAFLQYTSGSTGTPKGVMVTHANLVHNIGVIRDAFGFGAASRMVSWLPHNHDMGLIGAILTPLTLGVPTWLMAPVEFVRQPITWLRAVSEHRATVSGGPNFAYDLCTSRVSSADLAGVDLSSWRVAFNGAEPVRQRTIEAFSKRFAEYGFDSAAMLPCYGLAEGTLLAAGTAAAPAQARRFDLARLDAGIAVPAEPGA
ncbi:MAG: AMP-binding protein, partial [Jatrophihabitantaceae bacterium]